MRRFTVFMLIIALLVSLVSCRQYNPAEETEQRPTDETPEDNGTPENPPADGEYTFTATLMLGGSVFVPTPESDPDKALKVRWTDGTKYYTVPVGQDGVAVCPGLDGEYSVTLINLPDEYSYNPNIYKANNGSRDVVIELKTLSEGIGDGTGEFNCIEITHDGVYRARITQTGQYVYFQFTPTKSGIYVIESMMDVSAGMYNPVMRMYNGSSQYKYPDEVIDGGGISGSYTTNFQKTIIVPTESYVGNSYTFDVYVEGRDAVYPVNVDFTVTYKGTYDDYVANEKEFQIPKFIPKNGYDEWYEAYVAYLMADRVKFGDVYRDASVSIGGKNVFSSDNYRLSADDGMHQNELGEWVYDPFDPKDSYYHVYNPSKYPTTGGWGPILYAAVSVAPCPVSKASDGSDSRPFIDSAFSAMESAGNNALSLGEKATENYKIFIEGYYNIISSSGEAGSDQPGGNRVDNYYFCVKECPCLAAGNGGACAIEDRCQKCDANCRNIPRAAIGQKGYADIAIDGMCPVTAELKDFLQKYCLSSNGHVFKDGNGFAETHDPEYHADHASMWLFACGYYE